MITRYFYFHGNSDDYFVFYKICFRNTGEAIDGEEIQHRRGDFLHHKFGHEHVANLGVWEANLEMKPITEKLWIHQLLIVYGFICY